MVCPLARSIPFTKMPRANFGLAQIKTAYLGSMAPNFIDLIFNDKNDFNYLRGIEPIQIKQDE